MAKGQDCIDAKYTPGRDACGRFIQGNKLSVGSSGAHLARFKELRSLFWSVLDDDTMRKLTEGMVELALNAKSEDVKLRANIYLHDRAMGKLTEHVEVEGVNQATQINLNLLTADEVKALSPLLPKLLAGPHAAPPTDAAPNVTTYYQSPNHVTE